MYIKALEQEVLRIRDSFTTVTRERDYLTEENSRLKALLASHGIVFNNATSTASASGAILTGGVSDLYSHPSEGSVSGSQQLHSAVTDLTSAGPGSGFHQGQPQMAFGMEGYNSKAIEQPMRQAPGQGRPGQGQGQMDLDQIGIDFVLTYERTPYLSPPPQ